ncbi:MAG: CpsB/CapC family capsule biosynthesis tyrosine phosphatase [Syntrophales bacterium]|jgi:protein-tyrosine phosphatase|nr:CpsB/CapC family capsule biosynthesis tyrosine phosphatase [Syntrophales bacterium]
MIDVHCHILPFLDDGPKTMDEALEMCRIASDDGIHTIVATPHCYQGKYPNSTTSILPVYEALRNKIRSIGIPINLHAAGEVHIDPDLVSFLEENPGLCIGGRFVLIEIHPDTVPPSIVNFLFHMRLAGFTPILTHPERNRMVQARPDILADWISGGGLVQITAMSLTGHFGSRARETVFSLLERGWVHCVASDAHSSTGRTPVLSGAVPLLDQHVGREGTEVLLEGNPRRMLDGRELSAVFPAAWPYRKTGMEMAPKKKSLLAGFLGDRLAWKA